MMYEVVRIYEDTSGYLNAVFRNKCLAAKRRDNKTTVGEQVKALVYEAVRPTSDPRNWHLGIVSEDREWIAVYVAKGSAVSSIR